MTKVEVETFPHLAVLARSAREEAAAHRRFCWNAPAVFLRAWKSAVRISAFRCVLDIAGTEKLFGPPERLAHTLLDRIDALGIAAAIAVSRNFHAAVVLAAALAPARACPRDRRGRRRRRACAPAASPSLDLAAEQAETFALWGIATLGMLAALPEKELIARMGQDGQRLRQLARGERPHLFQPSNRRLCSPSTWNSMRR